MKIKLKKTLMTVIVLSLFVVFSGFCFASDKNKPAEKEGMEPGKILSWIRALVDRLPSDFEKGDSVQKWWPLGNGTVHKYRIIKSAYGLKKELVGTEFTVKLVKLDQNKWHQNLQKYSFQVEGFDEWPYKSLIVRKNRIFLTGESGIEEPLIVFPLKEGLFYGREKNEYDLLKNTVKYHYKDGFYAPLNTGLRVVHAQGENIYRTRIMHSRRSPFTFEKGKGMTEWQISYGLVIKLVE